MKHSNSLIRDVHYLRVHHLGWANPSIDVDSHPEADHIVVYSHDKKPIACVSHAPIPHQLAGQPQNMSAIRFFGFAVSEDIRGTGIGSLLMTQLQDRVLDRGNIKLIWANARLSAIPFYHKHGFISVGSIFTDPITGRDDLRIIRQLQ